MIEPEPRIAIASATIVEQINVPVRLTSITALQSSSDNSSRGANLTMPALLTQISGVCPNSSNAALTSSVDVTEATSGVAFSIDETTSSTPMFIKDAHSIACLTSALSNRTA